MNPASAQFSQLLEKYVFKVTSLQIEQTDSAMQTALIAFWQTISDATIAGGLATVPASPQPTEWEAVLQEPINWRSINRRWVQGLIRERSQCHSKYLARLEQAMATTRTHMLALQTSTLSEPSRTRLAAHYAHILRMFQRQLTSAQHIQRVYFAHLKAGTP